MVYYKFIFAEKLEKGRPFVVDRLSRRNRGGVEQNKKKKRVDSGGRKLRIFQSWPFLPLPALFAPSNRPALERKIEISSSGLKMLT